MNVSLFSQKFSLPFGFYTHGETGVGIWLGKCVFHRLDYISGRIRAGKDVVAIYLGGQSHLMQGGSEIRE